MMPAKPSKPSDPYRVREIGALHAMATELALTEETRRDLIARIVPGKRSAAQLTARERGAVLDELRRLGAGRRRPRPAPDRAPTVALARALWISLHQLGAVADPSDEALDAFARRQTQRATPDRAGLPLAWCGPDEWPAIIEALWAMARRHGMAKPTRASVARLAEARRARGLDTPPALAPKLALLHALWRALTAAGAMGATLPTLDRWLTLRGLPAAIALSPDEADRAAAALARWLAETRAARGGAP